MVVHQVAVMLWVGLRVRGLVLELDSALEMGKVMDCLLAKLERELVLMWDLLLVQVLEWVLVTVKALV